MAAANGPIVILRNRVAAADVGGCRAFREWLSFQGETEPVEGIVPLLKVSESVEIVERVLSD